MRDRSQRIIVGRVTGIYGVKGWVKVMSYTRPRENIFSYNPWLIKQDGDWREIALLDNKQHGKGLIAALAGLTDRDTARAVLGADIAIDQSQLQEPGPGEYYWHDLFGLQVINQENITLGTLKEIVETGANDVLVVEGEQRHLIPLIWKIYVLKVDLDLGIIRVDWESAG
ncbi:MAG: ribosome maturation factor RimM [Gammaproteobacteria bacterium]|nr:ribosome maturation factor RimM [Gammaproteobacteria bacterium]